MLYILTYDSGLAGFQDHACMSRQTKQAEAHVENLKIEGAFSNLYVESI